MILDTKDCSSVHWSSKLEFHVSGSIVKNMISWAHGILWPKVCGLGLCVFVTRSLFHFSFRKETISVYVNLFLFHEGFFLSNFRPSSLIHKNIREKNKNKMKQASHRKSWPLVMMTIINIGSIIISYLFDYNCLPQKFITWLIFTHLTTETLNIQKYKWQ